MANKVNRAAQFLPFDALKGLKEELKSREEKYSRVEKKEISEDAQEEISNTLVKIKVGSKVRIVFYQNGHYFDLEGEIAGFNKVYRYITIGQTKIYYDDIYAITIITI